MNFEFSEDQKLLKDQVRRFLDDKCASKDVRTVLDGAATYNESVWNGLKDMGLMGTAIPEEYGGSGAGYLELCVIAEELGRAVAPVPFSSSIYLAAETLLVAGTEEQKQAHLPKLAAGDKIATLAISEHSGRLDPSTLSLKASDGTLKGSKSPVVDGSIADLAIVVARTGPSPRDVSLYLVDLRQDAISRKTLDSIDPTRDLAEIAFNEASGELIGEPNRGWDVIEKVFDRGAVLFAFEQLGGAQKALESAVDYAKERYAFGRPIGSFQAVKHMLADMYVSAELARSNCYYGAWALSTDAPELAEAAATARVAATKAYQHCSKNNIQTHGGMGFTWEFDCHLHYRRSNLLALVIGSRSQWEDQLIDRLEARNAA